VYWHYFHFTIATTPLGLLSTVFTHKSDAKLFLVVYTMVGGYFSGKMIRLVLLISPAAAVCAAGFIDFCIAFLMDGARTQPPLLTSCNISRACCPSPLSLVDGPAIPEHFLRPHTRLVHCLSAGRSVDAVPKIDLNAPS
jgi:hypothetical protein